MKKQYFVNEIFFSLQGEGVRAGTPNVFVRFGKCNLSCRVETHGFDCDTEFESGKMVTVIELGAEIERADTALCRSVILTGGEPALQVDDELIDHLHGLGYYLAIETNGSKELPDGIDWVTVSPKVAEHALRQRRADEVKYIRGWSQGIPRTKVKADHYLISPRFDGGEANERDLRWCIELVKQNPPWRLSCQQHNWWGIR